MQSENKILTLAEPDREALDGAFGTCKAEYWWIKNNTHNIEHHKIFLQELNITTLHNYQNINACKTCDSYFDGGINCIYTVYRYIWVYTHTMQVN